MPKLMQANKMKIQNPTAAMRYGVISFTTPPAIENAIVAKATPLARLASGKISVG